jgi:hypothetical protein
VKIWSVKARFDQLSKASLALHYNQFERGRMMTQVTVDDELLAEAHKLSGQRTRAATITEALEEYVRRRKQLGILKLFGKIEYDDEYDYKESRW